MHKEWRCASPCASKEAGWHTRHNPDKKQGTYGREWPFLLQWSAGERRHVLEARPGRSKSKGRQHDRVERVKAGMPYKEIQAGRTVQAYTATANRTYRTILRYNYGEGEPENSAAANHAKNRLQQPHEAMLIVEMAATEEVIVVCRKCERSCPPPDPCPAFVRPGYSPRIRQPVQNHTADKR